MGASLGQTTGGNPELRAPVTPPTRTVRLAGNTPPRGLRLESLNIVDELHAIATALATAGIPYAVCGGIAVTAYGATRSTKDIDVAIARYEAHSAPGPICQLAGDETPLDADVLRERYGDADGYMEEFEASLDATIAEGFLLERDRDVIAAEQEDKARDAFE